jgi:transcription antitermination factor NusG
MSYWAVARSVPNHDRLAAECIALAGFEIFVPRVRSKVGAKWRTMPLFPSYLFVRIESQWRAIERTMGVFAVVKNGSMPARCPDVEIKQLLERADPDGIIRLGARPSSLSRHEFTPGAAVSIAAGPLAGFSGLYAGQKAADRELILLDLLGRQTPVTIDAGLLTAR